MGNRNSEQKKETNTAYSAPQKNYIDKQFKEGFKQIEALKKENPKKQLELNYWHYEKSLESVQYFCDELSKLVNLQKLTLDFKYFQIEGQALKIISNALAVCRNLTYLDLMFQQNLIDSQSLEDLIEQLAKCQKLETLKLYFGQNLIQDFQAKNFVKTLKCLPNLQVFVFILINNNVTQEGVTNICKAIQECPNITQLQLGLRKTFNLFEKDSMGFNFQGFGNIQEMTLFLDENTVTFQQAQWLGENISNCANLRMLTLSLNQNQINLNGSISVIEGLGKCRKLQNLTLRISSNPNMDDHLYKISKSLKHLDQVALFEITFGVKKNTRLYQKIKIELFKQKRLARFWLY